MSEVIDNKANRIRVLKDIIKHLHAGNPPEQVQRQMQEIVRQTDASEIMAMEQELIAEGMPVEEVRSMCDLHSKVTRDVLVQLPIRKAIAPGHPVDTFRRENEALRGAIAAMTQTLAELQSTKEAADAAAILLRFRQSFNDLMDIDKHYQRKEHALFSCLERHGIAGPSKVMWAKDDEVRNLLKRLGECIHFAPDDIDQWKMKLVEAANAVFKAVQEMIYKEENILLPMSLETLSEDEWAEIWSVSPKYGWCIVEPQQGYTPAVGTTPESMKVPPSGALMLPTGNVSLEQLVAVFSTLPLDLTFVDADDRVAFFTEGPDRIFARSKAIIGRKVQHCHPPRSVETVDQILSDFRASRQSVAEFWINFHDKFVHVRYFAVRNSDGAYLGTVELTQDLTPLRALQGEKRLLEYDSSAVAS
ncbi:MAG TPA: DUF438 domain-containing protein [Terriglobales bacterium]|nr:DUF438 domain-containing protein [Terriglobales bacterium]